MKARTLYLLLRIQIFIFGISLLLFSVPSAFGAVGIKPDIPPNSNHPGWFVYALDKGESYKDTVRVYNSSATPALIQLYTVDGHAHFPKDPFLLKHVFDDMTEIGAWVKLEKNLIVVPPKEYKTVDFTITIPKEEYPSEHRRHTGAIVAEDITKTLSSQYGSGSSIGIGIRNGVRIYNTIPSPLSH